MNKTGVTTIAFLHDGIPLFVLTYQKHTFLHVTLFLFLGPKIVEVRQEAEAGLFEKNWARHIFFKS